MLQGTGATGLSTYLTNTLLVTVPSLRSTNIYDYEVTDLAGFPAATITLSEVLGKVLDNNRNQRTFRFVIRVFIDRLKQNLGASNAESILRTITNDFISKVDADPTLGGNCIIADPFSVKYGYVDREQQNIRMAEITLDCVDANTWR